MRRALVLCAAALGLAACAAAPPHRQIAATPPGPRGIILPYPGDPNMLPLRCRLDGPNVICVRSE
jgi:hypothetical protein